MESYGTANPGPARLSNGITVDVEPFTADGRFLFRFFRGLERVGGDLGSGTIELGLGNIDHDQAEALFARQNTIHLVISQDDPVRKMEVFGWIVQKTWGREKSVMSLDFVVSPRSGPEVRREFWATPGSDTWPGASEALTAAWPGFRVDTEPEPGIPATRVAETKHAFLCRLLYSWKPKTVFGFGLTGGFVKDIYGTDWATGEPEPSRELAGGSVVQSGDSLVRMTYNRGLYQGIRDTTKETGSAGFGTELTDGVHRIYRKEVARAHRVYRENMRLMGSGLFSTKTVRYTDNLPAWRLGDLLTYGERRESSPPVGTGGAELTDWLVTEMYYFVAAPGSGCTDESGATFSVVTTIRGTQDITGTRLPGGPECDPGKNEGL